MANRTRDIKLNFFVTQHELDFIHKKMEVAKTKNLSAYIRKMSIDGHIINVDFSELRELFASIGRASGGITQIAKRINMTNNIYKDDVEDLKERQERIWQLLKSIQSRLP